MVDQIECIITLGSDRTTTLFGKNIDEIIEKIQDFHTLGEFEKQHFTKKGTLETEKASGWYLGD